MDSTWTNLVEWYWQVKIEVPEENLSMCHGLVWDRVRAPSEIHQQQMAWLSQGTTYDMSTNKTVNEASNDVPTEPEDGGNMRLRNIGKYLRPNRRIHPRKLQFSSTSLTKKKKSQTPHVMNSQDINSHYTVTNSHDVFTYPHPNYSYILQLYSYKLPLYRYELQLHSNKLPLNTFNPR